MPGKIILRMELRKKGQNVSVNIKKGTEPTNNAISKKKPKTHSFSIFISIAALF